jgi:holo-[acyl-carrier protein] synthase
MPETLETRVTKGTILGHLDHMAHEVLAPARVGVDAVHIPTWAHQLTVGGERLLERTYTPMELEFCAGRPDRLSSRLAGKEAVLKALGTGVRGIGFADVEIVSEPTGRPTVVLHGPACTRAEELAIARFELSLCHEGEFALAVVAGLVERPR